MGFSSSKSDTKPVRLNISNMMKDSETKIDKKRYLNSLLFSTLFFALSIVLFNVTDSFTNKYPGKPVSDLILDNIPVMHFYAIYIYGPALIWLFLLVVCFFKPRSFPYVLKTMALLIVVRSLFTIFTHIGPPDHTVVKGYNAFASLVIKQIDFSDDMFFSGHTALPFLMGLIFWRYRGLRIIFISSSIVFGIVVLACHVHYSIDVFAAFFIAHSIYIISKKVFAWDYRYFAG